MPKLTLFLFTETIKELNDNQRKVLKEEIEEKSKSLDRSNKLLEKAEAWIKELENKLAEQSINLDKSNNSLEKAEEKIKTLEKNVLFT